MKKKLLILFLLTGYFTQAQYTAIPDSCFEYILIYEGIDTEGLSDGQVLTADIQNVTSLDLEPSYPDSNCHVGDTTGIEGFTNLEFLNIGSDITSIDLSNNIHLKEVYDIIGNLQHINISNCTELTTLSLPNNQISTIDLSDNINLIHLNLNINILTNIDLTNNNNIQELYLGANLITIIDISNLSNLNSFGCSQNHLEYLNIKNNNNQNITVFNALNNPNLTCIYVDDAIYSTDNWLNIDQNSTFVETETECNALNTNETVLENELIIYPNPVKNILYFKNKQIKEVTVYNILGKKILKENKNTIDFSNLNNGIYIVKILTNENKIITKKIIKVGA